MGTADTKPLISVIVPIYNVEQYLRECVDSIRNQTYRNLEIILVDDGSPDGCPAICDEYAEKDGRIKVIHKKNGGLSDARNTGMEKARGSMVAFVDSDDTISKNMIEELLGYIQKYHADLVLCDVKSEKYKESILLPWKDKTVFSGEAVRQELLASMLGNLTDDDNTPVVWGSVWRGLYQKEKIQKYSIAFPQERETFSEDLIFSVQYLSHIEKAVICKEKLYDYRDNDQSIMNSFEKYHKNMFLSRQLLVKSIREQILQLENNRALLLRAGVSERRYYQECIINACRKGENRTGKEMRKELSFLLKQPCVVEAFRTYRASSLKTKLLYGSIRRKRTWLIYLYYKMRLKTVS